MKLADLARMPTQGLAWDSETYRIVAGLTAPRLVCASVGWLGKERIEGKLLSELEAIDTFLAMLRSPDCPIIAGANIAFDLMVIAVRVAELGVDLLPEIYAALMDAGRIFDVQHAEALDAIAEGCLGKDPRNGGPLINPETGRRGRYSLATCLDLVCGRKDAKINDEWRQSYGELHPYPIETWPQTARDYPVDDAVNTWEIALTQAGFLPRAGAHRWGPDNACEWCGMSPGEAFDGDETIPCKVVRRSRNLHDLANQVGTAFAMSMGAGWGFRVDQGTVDCVLAGAMDGRAEAVEPFIETGLIKRDKVGETSRDMSKISARVALAYGADPAAPCPTCNGTRKVPSTKNPKAKINCSACAATGFDLDIDAARDVPRTDTGRIGTGRDVLNESGDELLMELADYQEDAKIIETYCPFLRRARVPVAGHGEACPARTEDTEACTCEGPYRDIPLTLWPNVLLETGRTSYGGVIQQFPRKPGYKNAQGTYIPSLRECIAARPGWVFSSEDYEAGELVTDAQSCLWITGYSRLAEALNSGIKVHNALGASMIGLGYEEFQKRVKERACKDARQAAKPGNFGFPGGMGPVKMVQTQRRQGPDTPCPFGPTWIDDEDGNEIRGYKGLRFCILMDGTTSCGDEKLRMWHDKPIAPTCAQCIACAVRLKETWLAEWPEHKPYFQFINSCIENGQTITGDMLARWPWLQDVYRAGQQLAPGEIMQHVSGRVRGGLDYCAAANGYFQGLLADAAKSALRRVSRECYDRTVRVPDMAHANSLRSRYAGGPSPLLGSRVIVFQHDELLAEHPESSGHDGAMRISEVMVDELRWYCPDLAPACKADPTLMRRWFKGASARWARGGAKAADQNDRLVPWQPEN